MLLQRDTLCGMRTPSTVTIIAAVILAIIAAAAGAQPPPRSYSMSTPAIARHVARNAVMVEICGIEAHPLPFNHADQPYRRSALFRRLVQREIVKLEALMADHGDTAICDCLAEGRARCP